MTKMFTTGFRFLLLAILAWGCWLMIRLSWPYRVIEPNVDFLLSKQNVYHVSSWRISFYTHVFTSILVLVAGFTQFSKTILRNYTRIHRITGWVYFVVVLGISGPAAFIMALKANGGLPARASFTTLAIMWYACTLMALIRVKQHRFQSHADWMIRSYALTLSAITLRIYAYMFDALHINVQPRDVYITIAWLSWVPNLLVAEMITRLRARKIKEMIAR
ncbi:MAG: DUF2306 domain-containing protein [Chitinophagaceae bacterium]